MFSEEKCWNAHSFIADSTSAIIGTLKSTHLDQGFSDLAMPFYNEFIMGIQAIFNTDGN